MADEKAKTGLAAGAGGLIGAAAALLLARKAEAAPPPVGEVTLDEAAMNLLLAIAESADSIDADTSEVFNAINRLAAALGVSVLGNPPEILNLRVFIPVVNQPIQLPNITIPYDMRLVIKAWPTNMGLIYIANSRPEALNINAVYPLLANELYWCKIKNMQQLWLNATRAGESAVVSVEQQRRP